MNIIKPLLLLGMAGLLAGCNWTSLVSVSSDGNQGNAHSNYPSISADGRYVAFDS
jgi:hypothetical protein